MSIWTWLGEWGYAGVFLWSGFWGIGGYVFGRDLDAIESAFHGLRPFLLIAVGCASALILAWLFWRRRSGWRSKA